MRYLLDELMAYEEGFGDILMGDRASERHETFMGAQDLSGAISKADLMVFETKLIQQMQGLLKNHHATSSRSEAADNTGRSVC